MPSLPQVNVFHSQRGFWQLAPPQGPIKAPTLLTFPYFMGAFSLRFS